MDFTGSYRVDFVGNACLDLGCHEFSPIQFYDPQMLASQVSRSLKTRRGRPDSEKLDGWPHQTFDLDNLYFQYSIISPLCKQYT
jgi:hypothetical protein